VRLKEPLGGRRTIAWASLSGSATALALYVASLRDYGAANGGDELVRVVRESYVGDVLLANAKLAAMLVAAGAVNGAIAGIVLVALEVLRRRPTVRWRALFAGAVALLLEAALAFGRALVESPGSVTALWPYETSRLDVLYDHLQPGALEAAEWSIGVAATLVVLAGAVKALLARRGARAVESHLPSNWLARPAFLGITTLGALGAGVLTAPSEPVVRVDPRPNVLVLLSDSLRADRIGAMRDGMSVTPNIDTLARRGRSFANCFVPVARTTESVVSLMTSSWPQAHGVRTSWFSLAQCRLTVPALAEVLAAAGYDTYGTGEWNASDFGRLQLGFERVEVPRETWNVHSIVSRGGRATAFLVRLFYANALGESLAPEVYYYPGAYGGPCVTERVGRALARAAHSSRPSLVVAFYGSTHAPFTAKGEHLRAFGAPSYRGPNRYCLMAKTIAEAVSMQSERMRERDLEQVQRVYDAAVRTFDDEVGEVLARLDAEGIAGNTVVLVGSDHGTAFYERGSFGQGNELASDVSNRVPLVVFDPRLAMTPRGAAPHVVRSIDIAPTLCDLAGVRVPAAWQGRSLRPVLEDPASDLGLRAYAETGLWIAKQPWQSDELDFGFPSIYEMLDVPDRASGLIATKDEYVRLMIRAQHRMVRDDRWKLLYVPTRHAPLVKLYDLAAPNDPARDVASEHPDVVASLRTTLDAILAKEPPSAFEGPLLAPRSRP
jgi:arylsulfatase A-like enzyme